MQAILGERDQRLEQWAQTITQMALRQENMLITLADNLADFTRIAETIADQGIAGAQEARVNMPLIPESAE
jgi:predicted amino acid racemase